MTFGAINLDRIQASLHTRRIGTRIEFLPETSSTNDEAWARTNADRADGLVILTDHQTAGRGRLGRTWYAPRGAGLLLSVLLVDQEGDATPAEQCLIPAVAACDAIAAITDVRPTIHWPNDLYVGTRKLAGTLLESRRSAGVEHTMTVMGIGINCLQQPGHFPDELRPRATSLEIESPRAIDRSALATALLHRLDYWLARPRTWVHDELREAWRSHAEPPGQPITLRCGERRFHGAIVDIDPAFALIVRLDDGRLRAFQAAETTVLPL